MAITRAKLLAFKVLSNTELDLKRARQLAQIKALYKLRGYEQSINYKIPNGTHMVPIRIYSPLEDENALEVLAEKDVPFLFFIHGGGWVTESIETYDSVCLNMAQRTGCVVLSVEYRLAPEFRYPVGLSDCYAAVKALFTGRTIFHVKPEKITLVGDSAGGNLCAAISLMARDTGEFCVSKQILIYPSVYGDYSDKNPYPSVTENGTDYVLTKKKMFEYIRHYMTKEEDLMDPYFAPIRASDFSNQPATLILTAELDPLRDEGEAYGEFLKKAGNSVTICRLKDAIHGYFALTMHDKLVLESYEQMNRFLQEKRGDEMSCGRTN